MKMQRMIPKNKNFAYSNGFTLIEVLLSMTILSVVALILLQITGYININNQNSDLKEQAVTIANDTLNNRLERIASLTSPAMIGSQDETLTINGHTVYVTETDPNTKSYSFANDSSKFVSVSGIILLKNTEGNLVPRLLVVSVRWSK